MQAMKKDLYVLTRRENQENLFGDLNLAKIFSSDLKPVMSEIIRMNCIICHVRLTMKPCPNYDCFGIFTQPMCEHKLMKASWKTIW